MGNIKDAINTYDKSIEINPRNYDSYYCKSKLYLINAKTLIREKFVTLNKIIETLDKLIEIEPDTGYAYHIKALLLAQSSYNSEGFEKVLRICNEAIRLDKNSPEAYIAKVKAYEFLEGYKTLLYKSYIDLGEVLLNNNEPYEAINNLNKAININKISDATNKSSELRPYELKIKAIIKLGEHKEYLIDQLEQIIIAKPEILKFCEKELNNIDLTSCVSPESYIIQGLIFYHLGKYKKSVKAYNKVIEELRDEIRVNASVVFEELTQKRIIFADALNNKGNALCELSRSEEDNISKNMKKKALECYDEAIKVQPTNKLYYCNRGKLLNDRGDLEKALKDFEEAYSLNSNLNLRKDNEDYIKVILDQNKLRLQKAIEIQKSTLMIEEQVKNLSNALQQEFETLKLNSQEIVNGAVSNFEEIDKAASEVHYTQQNKNISELTVMHEKIQSFEQELNKINKALGSKVDKNQLEPHVFKVSEKILENPKLHEYYSALFDKLNAALQEAEVITSSDKVALDTSDIKVKALSIAISLVPIVGKYLSPTIEVGGSLYNAHNIKTTAKNFKQAIGQDPSIKEQTLKKIAEIATLNKIGKIENIENIPEVKHWKNKGLINKCKDFIIVNVDDTTGDNDIKILGRIDALKIINALSTKQFKFNVNQEENIKNVSDIITVPSQMFQESIFPPSMNDTVVNIVNQIEYDNPILNKPGLLQELSKSTGLSLYKVLDNSNILIQAGYENIITQAVNNQDVAKLGGLLVGIDCD